MLAALLKRGCQVNAPTNDGWTALHEAAANGHALIVDKLLASGAQASTHHCALPAVNHSHCCRIVSCCALSCLVMVMVIVIVSIWFLRYALCSYDQTQVKKSGTIK